MKIFKCSALALCFLMIGNLAATMYSFNELNKKEYELDIKITELDRLETKIDMIYQECKLRDSTIYRTLLELREEVTGSKTINSKDKIAKL